MRIPRRVSSRLILKGRQTHRERNDEMTQQNSYQAATEIGQRSHCLFQVGLREVGTEGLMLPEGMRDPPRAVSLALSLKKRVQFMGEKAPKGIWGSGWAT